MSSFDKEYRDNLLLKIKQYVSIFDTAFKNSGEIIYSSSYQKTNSSKAKKIISVFGVIWGVLILSIVSILIYFELVVPAKTPISPYVYATIVVIFIILLFSIVLINIRTIKRIETITASNQSLIFKIIKANCNRTDIYYFKDLTLKIKKRRQQAEHTLRGKIFNIYASDKKKKSEYLLNINCEEEFFAFTLYIDALLNHIDITSISDDEMYKMYHSKYFFVNK